MREIHIDDIIITVEQLCIDANCFLSEDIINSFKSRVGTEESEIGKTVLKQIIENAEVAKQESVAICQDTGMAVVYVDIGQEVHIAGGSISEAINEGVRRGYKNGYLRASVVAEPLDRINTKDNTPAVIHFNIVEGDVLKITVAPKGFGSENMSKLKMLKPSDGIEGVKKFILETVEEAGPNPCPPIIVGVGIGGTMEKCAMLSKKALIRAVDKRSDKESIRKLEEELLESINKLGIGPAGLGGRTTAIAVNIETFATHIAGLPVAVNIGCHVTRHAEKML